MTGVVEIRVSLIWDSGRIVLVYFEIVEIHVSLNLG